MMSPKELGEGLPTVFPGKAEPVTSAVTESQMLLDTAAVLSALQYYQ